MEVIDNYPKFRISVKINQGVNLRKFKKKIRESNPMSYCSISFFFFFFYCIMSKSKYACHFKDICGIHKPKVADAFSTSNTMARAWGGGAMTHTHRVSGDRDPSEDAPWWTLWDNLLSGLSCLSYAIIFHYHLFLAFLTFFTSRVVPSIGFCSWCPGKERKHAKTEGTGKQQVKCSYNA